MTETERKRFFESSVVTSLNFIEKYNITDDGGGTENVVTFLCKPMLHDV